VIEAQEQEEEEEEEDEEDEGLLMSTFLKCVSLIYFLSSSDEQTDVPETEDIAGIDVSHISLSEFNDRAIC